MKKHKRLCGILFGSLLVLLGVIAAYAIIDNMPQFKKTAVCALSGIETDIGNVTEKNVLNHRKENQKSYIEKYGLEEIDKPEKREDEQALLKLEELAKKHVLVRKVYENREVYSMEMIHNLCNNPEMAAYVLASTNAENKTYGGITKEEREADFPLLLQFDPRWGYYEYGGKEMGISGCGPTCLSMVILSLTDNKDVTPDEIAAYSMENGYYVKNVGTAWKLMDEVPPLYGLRTTHIARKEDSMKAALDQGAVFICSMRKGVFTSEGHFIVVYGYDETGFKVNDPKCIARSKKTWKFEEFGNQLKQIWSISAENQKNS